MENFLIKELIKKLKDGTKKNVILHTDTYNEVDDQYTPACAMRSPEKLNRLAVTVAPFLNERSTSAGDGLQVPCKGVCTAFLTTIPELAYYLKDKSPLCDYLLSLTRAYNRKSAPVWSRVI